MLQGLKHLKGRGGKVRNGIHGNSRGGRNRNKTRGACLKPSGGTRAVTGGLKIRCFIFHGPIHRLWPLHNHSFHFQNVAHLFDFGNGLVYVLLREAVASVLLVKAPVLLVGVGLRNRENNTAVTQELRYLFGDDSL